MPPLTPDKPRTNSDPAALSVPGSASPTLPPTPLRRADQPAVAGLVLLALAAMGIWWLTGGGHRGNLVDIDLQPPREALYAVDVNRAEWPELAQLPEIGESTARRIVEWRRLHGPFASPDELDHVPGIGPKTLERIRPYIRIESPNPPPRANSAARPVRAYTSIQVP